MFVYIDPGAFLDPAAKVPPPTEYCLDLIDAGRISYDAAKKELSEKQGDFTTNPNGAGSGQTAEQQEAELREKKKLQEEYERKLKLGSLPCQHKICRVD